jgi:large subunit ribosomal protein L10e
MAKLRKWAAYKTIERSYTRWSKVRKKAFVKSKPGKKVIKFDMGDVVVGKNQFPLCVQMISKELTNVRSNAIEAARVVVLKRLEKKLGRTGFYFRIKMFPHHVIRENPLAAGAGADRLSTGMKHSFGKTIGTAAKIEKGKILMEIYLPKEEEELARNALNVASKKLPLSVTIQATKQKAKKLSKDEIERKAKEDEKLRLQDEAKAKIEAEKAEKAAAKKTEEESKKE